MKKNIILSGVLLFLFGVAYLLEEHDKEERDYKKEGRLLSRSFSENLIKIETFKTKVHFVNKSLFVDVLEKKYPADIDIIEKILKHLKNLKVKRVIGKNELSDSVLEKIFLKGQYFFDITSKDEVNKLIIGAPLSYSKEFYVKHVYKNETRIYIVEDITIDGKAYSQETGYKNQKNFEFLKEISNAPYDSFISKKIFHSPKKLKAISITPFNRKGIKVDFEKLKTDPSPYKKIKISKKRSKEFLSAFFLMKASGVYFKPDLKLLNIFKSSILLNYDNGAKQVIKYYRRYGNLKGHYIFFEGRNILYEIDKSVTAFFFYNVQDFWDTRLPTNFINKEIELIFKKEGKSRSIKSYTQLSKDIVKTTIISGFSGEANQKTFFYFLSSMMDRPQYILGPDFSIKEKTSFDLKVKENLYSVSLKGQFIKLTDKKTLVQYFFKVGTSAKMSLEFNDLFIKDKS